MLKEMRMVVLRGDLGAGKTTLVKGIAEGLDAASRDDITSPTFTLIHEFRGPDVTLYHVDLYRIETTCELETLGLDEPLRRRRQSGPAGVGREISALPARAGRRDCD